MTKREREKLRRAILLVNGEEGYHEGMRMLLELAGMDTSRFELLARMKAVSVVDLPKENMPFKDPFE